MTGYVGIGVHPCLSPDSLGKFHRDQFFGGWSPPKGGISKGISSKMPLLGGSSQLVNG